MNRVLIPSFKSNIPSFEPKELGPQDIAVEFGGDWYLVGKMAQIENSLAERMQHGDFSSMEMQLLAKAAAAKAVGKSAEISTDVAVAAPLKTIDKFRTRPGETRLKDEQLELLQEALSEIRFKYSNTHSDIQTLKIRINNCHVLNEIGAVLETIPEEYSRYGLLQWGHGDLQLIIVNEGQIVDKPYSTSGMWSAVRHFQKITGLHPSDAQRAFITGYRYNGKMTSKISCEDEIRKAIKHHIMTDISSILNNLSKNNQTNVIVSGGSVHNKIAMELLSNECNGRDIHLHRIDELENVKDLDPTFSCLCGLKKFGNLRMDIGHSSLKSEIEM